MHFSRASVSPMMWYCLALVLVSVLSVLLDFDMPGTDLPSSMRMEGLSVSWPAPSTAPLPLLVACGSQVGRVEDVLQVDDLVTVTCVSRDSRGNIKLSRKALLPPPILHAPSPHSPRSDAPPSTAPPGGPVGSAGGASEREHAAIPAREAGDRPAVGSGEQGSAGAVARPMRVATPRSTESPGSVMRRVPFAMSQEAEGDGDGGAGEAAGRGGERVRERVGIASGRDPTAWLRFVGESSAGGGDGGEEGGEGSAEGLGLAPGTGRPMRAGKSKLRGGAKGKGARSS